MADDLFTTSIPFTFECPARTTSTQHRHRHRPHQSAMTMFTTLLAVGAAGLVSAVPLTCRQVIPHYPPNALSTGFRLVANVTDPATDLTPSVDGWELQGIHTGAGENDAVLSSESGRIFYHNGKWQFAHARRRQVLTTPPRHCRRDPLWRVEHPQRWR